MLVDNGLCIDWGKGITLIRWTEATHCNRQSHHTEPGHSSPRRSNQRTRL